METRGQFQRLLQFVKYCNLSQHAFEGRCKLANGYFNTRLKKEVTNIEDKNLSPKVIEKVCDAFPELSRKWLILGEGQMIISEQPTETEQPQDGAPYYDVDFLGGFDFVPNDHSITPTGYISMSPFNGDDFLWCNITGESMSPLIKSGSLICMKQLSGGVSDIIYGEVYALVIGNSEQGELQRTVKWVTRADDEAKIRLVPENKDIKYGTYQDVNKSDILKVFKVVFSGNVL